MVGQTIIRTVGVQIWTCGRLKHAEIAIDRDDPTHMIVGLDDGETPVLEVKDGKVIILNAEAFKVYSEALKAL